MATAPQGDEEPEPRFRNSVLKPVMGYVGKKFDKTFDDLSESFAKAFGKDGAGIGIDVIRHWIYGRRAENKLLTVESFLGIDRQGRPTSIVVTKHRAGEGAETRLDYQVSVALLDDGIQHFPLVGSRWLTLDETKTVKERPAWVKKLWPWIILMTSGAGIVVLMYKIDKAVGYVSVSVTSPLDHGQIRYPEVLVPISKLSDVDVVRKQVGNVTGLSAPTPQPD
ncbi:hypothetical protein [Streptomyces sp. NPDC097981]|uniref:hypothetical protein n=1 Tax=Streptomyces sp. NPDC097981 TaxID=3155428 RepID=UPI0033249A60